MNALLGALKMILLQDIQRSDCYAKGNALGVKKAIAIASKSEEHLSKEDWCI